MNSRSVSLALLGVNVALLGILGYMVFLLKVSPVPIRYVPKTVVVTNTVTQIAVRKVNATNVLAGLLSRPLSWSMLESTNYATYLANLRAFGVPEETIHDIIITDIAKLYARRRAAVRAQMPPPPYWRTGDAWDDAASHPEIQRQLRELDAEQSALVKELLGVDYQKEIARYWSAEDPRERQYGFLPPAKREQVAELLERFEQREQDFYVRTRGLMLEQDEAELRRLQQERDAELAKVLTPEELEEYQLRNSETAQALRSRLRGFQPSEEEFRQIFELQRSFDQTFNQPFDNDSERDREIREQARQEAQQAFEDELKKTLGEKRFAEYQRAQDNDYRTLLSLTERFELSQDAAAKVYEMKVAAERQRQRVEADPHLSEDQRLAALLAVSRETQKQVAATLGPQVFKAYQRAGGGWLRRLAPNLALSLGEPEQAQ
jgi:hypothetical protein